MTQEDRPHQGALLVLAPDQVALGLGPFLEAPAPLPDRPAFFAPDFFLRDPKPWKHPASFQVLEPGEAEALLPSPPQGRPAWTGPGREGFFQVFQDLKARIARGELAKAVPVVFETAPLPQGWRSRLPGLAGRALRSQAPGRPFAFWTEEGGLAGVSPEVLFRIEPGGRVHTAALAGTRPLERAEELLQDPKERKEHELVADFLVQALSPLGRVRREPTRLARLARLAHLETLLSLEPAGPLSFQDLVEALHPTPALGGYPRKRAWEWLAEKDKEVNRSRFGAPFGLLSPGGEAFCLVAIRCVQWNREEIRIGSGCGVVDMSLPEKEWEELERKREAVKWNMGL